MPDDIDVLPLRDMDQVGVECKRCPPGEGMLGFYTDPEAVLDEVRKHRLEVHGVAPRNRQV